MHIILLIFEAYILYEAIYIVKRIKHGIRTMTEKVIKRISQ